MCYVLWAYIHVGMYSTPGVHGLYTVVHSGNWLKKFVPHPAYQTNRRTWCSSTMAPYLILMVIRRKRASSSIEYCVSFGSVARREGRNLFENAECVIFFLSFLYFLHSFPMLGHVSLSSFKLVPRLSPLSPSYTSVFHHTYMCTLIYFPWVHRIT